MRKPTLKVCEYRHSNSHPYYLDLRPFGQGRKFFKTKTEADAEALRQRTLHQKQSREAVGLEAHELSTFIDAKKKLGEFGKTISNAVDFYIDHLVQVRRCRITVSELTTELLDVKEKDGRSEIYLRDLRSILAIFGRDFGSQLLGSVSSRELAAWLRDLKGSPVTRANFRRNISVLFGYAVDEGMIDANPMARVKKPKLVDKAPEIFTVDELAALLTAAANDEKTRDMVPMLSIAAFTGLRDAEIKRLDWSEVNLKRGFVEVKALKAKSAKRRLVRIQPNLALWLAPYAHMTGPVVPVNARKKLDTIREAAKLGHWSKNGLRHSFASYRLAATNDAALTASELGHSTAQMLYAVYREVVLPEEAERYWNIAPADPSNVVPFDATRAEVAK